MVKELIDVWAGFPWRRAGAYFSQAKADQSQVTKSDNAQPYLRTMGIDQAHSQAECRVPVAGALLFYRTGLPDTLTVV